MNECTQEKVEMLLTIAEAAVSFAMMLMKGEEEKNGKDECSDCLFKGMCHEAD